MYVLGLLLIKPNPNSLKAVPLTYAQNFKLIRASLCSGLFLLFIFLIISNYDFLIADDRIYYLLALNNNIEMIMLWPFQLITHLIIHVDFWHLIINVSGIGIASVYERRVGAKRFLSVLVVGSVASIPSIFFYSETIAISGISGGVVGLFAAYFTDRDELTTKEWCAAIFYFTIIMLLFSVDGYSVSSLQEYQTDYIGHIFGVLGVIIYCRFKPLQLLHK